MHGAPASARPIRAMSADPIALAFAYLAGRLSWKEYRAQRRRPSTEARVRLGVSDRRAVLALADALGTIAADLWVDGHLDGVAPLWPQ